jgi:hypothetical protein
MSNDEESERQEALAEVPLQRVITQPRPIRDEEIRASWNGDPSAFGPSVSATRLLPSTLS